MGLRSRGLLVAVLLVLSAGCSAMPDEVPRGEQAAPSASAGTATGASGPSVEVEAPAGGAPLLALHQPCYGLCVASSPLGLPAVTVYANGRVVRSWRTGSSVRPTLTTGSVSPSEVARLALLARQAQLTGGGATTLGFRNRVYADGGGDVLTARLSGRTTTVESPQAYDEAADTASTDPEQRRALRVLSEALQDLPTPDPYPASSVVVRAEPRPGQVGRVWTGPALAGLPADADARCAVLSGEPAGQALEAVIEDAFPSSYSDAGRVWIVAARPALPHEQDCAAVAETVRTSSGSGASS